MHGAHAGERGEIGHEILRQAGDEERRENSEVEPLRPAQAGQPLATLSREDELEHAIAAEAHYRDDGETADHAGGKVHERALPEPERVARGKLQRLAGNDHRHLLQNDQQAEHHGRKRPQALHLLLNAMSVGQESQRVATEQQRQHPDDAGERKQRRRHGHAPLAQHPILRAHRFRHAVPFAVRIIVVRRRRTQVCVR